MHDPRLVVNQLFLGKISVQISIILLYLFYTLNLIHLLELTLITFT